MPTAEEIIKRATIKARNDWVAYTVQQEKQIAALFRDTANRLNARIAQYAVEGKVPPGRLVALLDNVSKESAILKQRLGGKIKTGMSNSVDYGMKAGIRGSTAAQMPKRFKVGIGTSYIGKDGRIRRYDPRKELYKNSVWARINGNAMDALVRFKPAGMMFSQQVWNITFETQKTLRNLINTAVLEGLSPAKLSREVRQYLTEPEKLFRRVRKKGKLVLSRPALAFHPGQGMYRSSYKNAMRLARTEMARAYYEGSIRYATQKKWIQYGIWRTGSGNPCSICLDLAGQKFKKSEMPGIQHPHCFCWIEWIPEE